VNTLWISETPLAWIGTLLVGGLSAFWLVWDGLRLRRYLPKGREAHDEIFGSLIGLLIAAIGIIGVIRFWSG